MEKRKATKILYFLEFVKWSLLLLICIYFALMIFIGIRSYADSTESADAAIVLGASVRGSEPSPVYAERLNHAVILYKEGRVRHIITTGGVEGSTKKFSEGWVGKTYLMEKGIPENDILLETLSRTTFQNIYYGYELGLRHECATYLMVTDPIHMPRAMMMAKNVGMPAMSSPTKTSRYQSWAKKLELLNSESVLYMKHIFLRNIFSTARNPKSF